MILHHNMVIRLFQSHFDLVLLITERSQSISELLISLCNSIQPVIDSHYNNCLHNFPQFYSCFDFCLPLVVR